MIIDDNLNIGTNETSALILTELNYSSPVKLIPSAFDTNDSAIPGTSREMIVVEIDSSVNITYLTSALVNITPFTNQEVSTAVNAQIMSLPSTNIDEGVRKSRY